MISRNFHGAKLALISGNRLVVYQRDDHYGIPYPGCWDLPGGGREGDESPEQCVLRELKEEFGITLTPERLSYRRRYERTDGEPAAYFFGANASARELARISFGDEGQKWGLMTVDEYLRHPKGILDLQTRLERYLASIR